MSYPRAGAFVSFVPYALLTPGKQLGTEVPLRLEQAEDREAGCSVRLWETLLHGRTAGDPGKAN